MTNASAPSEASSKNLPPVEYKLSYSVGVAENTNAKCRSTMEDVHTYVENFVERLDWGYFAIFDGHAGQQAAKFCGQHLHSILEKKITENESGDIRELLSESFLEIDDRIAKDCKGSSGCTAAVAIIRWELPVLQSTKESPEESPVDDTDTEKSTTNESENELAKAGSQEEPVEKSDSQDQSVEGIALKKSEKKDGQQTKDDLSATTAKETKTDYDNTANDKVCENGNADDKDKSSPEIDLSKHRRMLYTANVGDTRIILYRDNKAIRLTRDHKGTDGQEIARIESCGGLIMKNRVSGMLAVTRSLGDHFFKGLVIGNPYTTSVQLDPSIDQFLIIACDGLWDVVKDQDACDLIKNIDDPQKAAKTLVDFALKRATVDNVTVMVINLRPK